MTLGSVRDLIEAGLSEPAGRRNGLWGLCRRRLAPEVHRAEWKTGWRGTAVVGSGGCGLCRPLAGGLVRPLPEATASFGTMAVAMRRSSPAGAWSARRSIGSKVVTARAGHEVSFQKEDRQGGSRHGRGQVMRVNEVLPQHGQRSCRCEGAASSVGSASGSGTSSSLRQSASFPARCPLARKP